MDLKKIAIVVLGSAGIAYGLSSDWMDFKRYFVISTILTSGITYYIHNREQKDQRVSELEGLLEKKQADERTENLEKMLVESDGVIAEQEEVIKNYEGMLDEASVKFPCNCGQNMFDGIFKPEEEVVVECDYCKNKYAITLKLDTVLLTEPIEDLNIDQLIKKNIK